MKKYFILGLIFLFIAYALSADNLMLEYLDGILEVKEGNNWVEAEIGDFFSQDATLRVVEDSIAELSLGYSRITLSEEGIYSVSDLLKSNREVASWGIGSLISSKLMVVAGDSQEGKTAVMGVRAAEAGIEPELEWMDEDEETLKEGKRYLNEARYKEALQVFQEGFDMADIEQEQEHLFYIGYCYTMLGENGPALKSLSRVEPDGTEPYFADLVILKGRLLLESLSFMKALDLLDLYLNRFPHGDNAQAAYFLSAVCFQGLGNNKEALKRLEKAHDLDPTSDLGKAASKGIDESGR